MTSVIKTSLGRILDLPVNIKDILRNESIVATNAASGRLYVSKSKDGIDVLDDANLLEDESGNYQYISLPLIEDLQIEEEKEEWDLAAKLKQVSDIEKDQYK